MFARHHWCFFSSEQCLGGMVWSLLGCRETLCTSHNYYFIVYKFSYSTASNGKENMVHLATNKGWCVILGRIPSIGNGAWEQFESSLHLQLEYWNRKWEVRVSMHPCMRWGMFALQATKATNELLPFIGQLFWKMKFKSMCTENSQFIKYVLQVKRNVYKDWDVLNGNIARFINSFIGREKITYMQWNYVSWPIL